MESRLSSQVFRKVLGIAILAIGAAGGCGGEEAPPLPAVEPIVDIPALAGRSSAFVDSVLGEPSEVTRITRLPEEMPGEYRDYTLPRSPDIMTVRFYRDQAVFFTLFLPSSEPTAERALQYGGVDVAGALPDIRAPAAQWWKGTFGGATFDKVGAVIDFETNGFNMIQARVEL